MIPLSIPNFEGNELTYVTDAVSEGWVSTGGAYIKELENKVAKFVNVEQAVACQSGTSALHLSLIASGVQNGELVIAPTLTFIAAVNPIRYMGADPIFMDCDDSLCMDPIKLCRFCERECDFIDGVLVHKATRKKIRALIVVHVFGNMADMETIMEIAHRFHLTVIEDATEAIGTRYESGKYSGKFAGTIGDFGAFSFNGNKIITTGGGGMVIGQDIEKVEHIRYLSTQAKDDALFYIHNEVGYNYRMTNVQAAIGVAQMELLPEFIKRKNKNYSIYCELLNKCENGHLMPFRKGTYSNKWFYALLIPKMKTSMRSLVNRLMEEGIQTRAIWGLIHEQEPYANAIGYEIEKAKYYSEHIINLPCSTNIKKEDISRVCDIIEKVIC